MSEARNFVPAENRRPSEPGFGPGDTDKPKLLGDPQLGPDPSAIPPTIDPTSAEGLRRDGIFETGIASDEADGDFESPAQPAPVTDTSSPETTAYTGSQKPNLPVADGDATTGAPRLGRLREPVEGRENNFVFDTETENFTAVDEVQNDRKTV